MRVARTVVACVLALCIISLDVPVVVQSSTPTPTPEVLPPTSDAPTSSSSESQPDSEAAILRAQLDVMRQYDERLLQTVYWALGTALALVVFAASAGWYVNVRLYEREKEALRSELHLALETKIRDISESVQQDVQEAQTSLDDALTDMGKDLREQTNRRFQEIEKLAREAGKAAADTLQAQFKQMQHDMMYMENTTLRRDAETWRERGVHTNELRAYIRSLSLATQLMEFSSANEWLVARALEGIQGALEAGGRPDVQGLTKITALLGTLPDEYSIEVERLRALLSTSRD